MASVTENGDGVPLHDVSDALCGGMVLLVCWCLIRWRVDVETLKGKASATYSGVVVKEQRGKERSS
jgi:hypothetical protein